jgi:hypothetical protein
MTNGDDILLGSTRDKTLKVNNCLHVYKDAEKNAPLTKREYFASQCLAGMMSENPTAGIDPVTLATLAVEQADELVRALNK